MSKNDLKLFHPLKMPLFHDHTFHYTECYCIQHLPRFLYRNPFTGLRQTTDVPLLQRFPDVLDWWLLSIPNFLHCQHCCLEICDYMNVIPGYRSAELSQTTYHDLTDRRLPFGNQGFETQLPAVHVYIGSTNCIQETSME